MTLPHSVSFSLDFVTALDVVTHSWRRDSKTQYGRAGGRGKKRDLFLMLWATASQNLTARESSRQ